MGKVHKQRGFTLIEMMMAITIAAILLVIAIPGMQGLSRRSQQLNAVGDISSMVARARSEAAARYKPVTICASADQSSCSGANTWETGWIMFEDKNDNQQHDSGEDLIQVGPALASGSTLAALSFTTPNSAVTFASGGLPDSPGTFRYCIYNGAQATMQAVVVNASGQARVASDSNGDGLLEDNTGAAIAACP